ncbi:MAG: CRP/FNR family cyclic AMP-dependent transcriptional regulator [Myxococcota bacterium]|jgi:CRP/FNR family cyclic AMP-dependent transcriptional regulator
MSTPFVTVPLFQGIDDSGLAGLGEVFEHVVIAQGDTLFVAGEPAENVYLLIDGSAAVQEDGNTQIELHPPSLIGELGAMTGLKRRVTAIALEQSTCLRATGGSLKGFFERNSSVAVTFYQNLLGMAADKIRRDEERIHGMKANIISTQKDLKKLRNLVLESPDSVVSGPVHDMVENLIAQNRRANYVVAPPLVMPAQVRIGSGLVFNVSTMSRQFVEIPADAATSEGEWTGVLMLDGQEVPISGSIGQAPLGNVRVELDDLIDEYGEALEHYLTQAQLLDTFL